MAKKSKKAASGPPKESAEEIIAKLEAELVAIYTQRAHLDLKVAIIQYRLAASMKPMAGTSCPIIP